MTPKPGGLFKLLSPLMSIGMKGGNARALQRLKERLEQRPPSAELTDDTPPPPLDSSGGVSPA
jgi:hypothetical protein